MAFGTKKRTTTISIPGRSSQESKIMALLQQLLSQSAGQLGDLSGIANGQLLGPTGADRELVQRSIGAASQLAQSEIARSNPILAARERENAIARGGAGSDETLNRLLRTLGQTDALNQAILQAQGQGAQSLLNLPLQRAGLQLSANQQLYNQIAGFANPLLQVGLQERMANNTTTTKQEGDWLSALTQLGQLATSFSLPGISNFAGKTDGGQAPAGMTDTGSGYFRALTGGFLGG